MFRGLLLILALFTETKDSYSQLCQGSLGDPIVNITFGAGSNPGPPLAAAATNYQYVTTDCPNDGFYAVRNSTNSCFGNSWYSLTGDHTGDPGGYFMLVNASVQPSAFYVDTVRGLCASTTYEFAAWILNMMYQGCNNNSILPNLTFRIEKTDGTVLQSFNSGNIPTTPTAQWKQYGFFFSTPTGVSDVVLRIINNASGGCGNDLALDDITFRPCGPLITIKNNGSNPDTVLACVGIPVTFSFSANVSGGYVNPSFQWQQNTGSGWTDIPGATGTSYLGNLPANTPPGIYPYRIGVAEAGNIGIEKCRVVSRQLVVSINNNPVTTVASNSPVCERSSLVLIATGGVQYAWTGMNNFSASGSPVTIAGVQLLQAGKYYVIVTNAAGCKHTDSTVVVINPGPVATISPASVNICIGDSVQLMAGGGGSYLWMPSSGLSSSTIANPKASPDSSTDYRVVVSNQLNCTDTVHTLVNVIPPPLADAGPDQVLISGRSVQLLANAYGTHTTINWAPPDFIDDPHALRPMVHPPGKTSYVMTVSSVDGCGVSTDTVVVMVYNGIYIPSAFTPNNDGLNDRWNVPVLKAFSSYEIMVFDRYGERVYHSVNNNNAGWDGRYKGKDLPQGSYCYVINIKDLPLTITGNVVLLR